MSDETFDHIIGRTTETAAIAEFLAHIADGAGRSLLMSGGPGVGKTEMLTIAIELAERRGLRVLRAAGVEFESTMGWSLLQELLLPLIDEINAASDDDASVLRAAIGLAPGATEGPDPAAVAAATGRLLTILARVAPVVIAVDDVHWADRRSAAVLRRLVAPGRGIAANATIAAIATTATIATTAASRVPTPAPPGRALPAREPPAARQLTIEPLDEPSSATLIDRVHPHLPPSARTTVLVAAQGNPLAICELPRALDNPRPDRPPPPFPLPLTSRLYQAFVPPVAALPYGTRQVLLRGILDPATAGSSEPIRIPDDNNASADLLRPAVMAGVVIAAADDPRPVLAHPLYAAALLADATADELSNVHRRLARDPHRATGPVVTARPTATTRPVVTARPIATGRPDTPGATKPARESDERSVSALEIEAEYALSRGDWHEALDLLRRAAALSPACRDRTRRLARGAQLVVGTDPDLAAEMMDAARTKDSGAGDSLIVAAAVSALAVNGSGDVDMAFRVLVDAIDRHPRHSDVDNVLLDALAELRSVCWLGGRPELWRDYRRLVGDRGTTASPTDAHLDDIDTESDPIRIVQIAELGATLDRLADCRTALTTLVDNTSRESPVVTAIWARLLLARDAREAGHWDAAAEHVDHVRRLSRNGGYHTLGWAADYEAALLAAMRGEEPAVADLTDAMAAWAIPRRAATVLAAVDHVQVLVAASRGDAEAVLAHAPKLDAMTGRDLTDGPVSLVWFEVVDAAVRTGRPEAARDLVDAVNARGSARESRRGTGESPRTAMIGEAIAALLADDGQAAPTFERALARSGTAAWPFDHARVQLAYGSHLRRHQAATAARPILSAAHTCFTNLGAQPWAERAAAELAATAQTRHAATDSDRRRLTPQEQQIADLAARGHSNKKIGEMLAISSRTVGNHLHHVYAKLGVSARGGLRDALRAAQRRQTVVDLDTCPSASG